MALSSRLIEIFNQTTKKLDEQVVLGDKVNELFPSHFIKLAGKHTTAGGGVNEAITASGVLSTDVVLVMLQTKGATPRTIVRAVPSTDTITVEFSADPSTDHIVAYVVLRGVT